MAKDIVVFFSRNEAGDVTIHGGTPDYDEQIRALPQNRDAKMEVVFSRNLQFHKKFFTMLTTAFDYMMEEDRIRLGVLSIEQLLIRLKLDLGLYTLYVTAEGGAVPANQPIYIPDSISFAKMDDSSFDKFYKSAIGVIIQKYVPNQNEDSMMQAVDAVLRFA